MTIAVGIAGEHPSGMDAGELAQILIKGTRNGHIPSRDFFSSAVDRIERPMREALFDAADAYLDSKNPRPILEAAASSARKAVQDTMETWSYPANAASTIRRKGFNNPLIATRSLLGLVYYEHSIGEGT